MTRVVKSTRATADDLMWRAAAEELVPAKSLARIDERAKQVVTSVGIVGTLVTGLGLVAGARFEAAGWPRWLAVAAVVCAVLAVVAALGVLLVRFPRRALRLSDVTAVERFYRRQFQRVYFAIAAGAALLVALLLAGAAAVGILVGGPDAAAGGLSVTVSGAGPDAKVSVKAELPGVARGATVTAEVTGVAGATSAVIGRQVIVTRAAGTVTIALDAVPMGAFTAVEVLVEAPHRRCTAKAGPTVVAECHDR
jgi:hypothetical protein